MEIVFLGTSSGVPTKTRNVSGIGFRQQNSKSWLLIDCGEGTQHRILHTNLSLTNLSAILITHVHGDHCYGLPGILASASMSGRNEPLTIIAPKPIQHFINAVIETSELNLNYQLNFIDVEKLTDSTSVGNIEIRAVLLSHRVPSFAYALTERPTKNRLDQEKLIKDGILRGPMWGKLQSGQSITLENGKVILPDNYLLPDKNNRTVIICGDNDDPHRLATLKSDTTFEANVELVVHEATYTQEVAEKVGAGPQHSCAKRISEYAESTGLKNLILTHFSPRYQDLPSPSPSIVDIEEEARRYYSGNLFLANDLDIFRLDKNGNLIHTKYNTGK
ncbi:MBL fold metallo-hydrolase [Aliikangiella coralliicola]|uniref:Ribonuclease Z n=1 Tax=Aliikangiella coralliicola TaxID=2592383 RepID=A0A545UIL2_9GAMM|nr:MBL fold metallo-hydrolase [Aliikangiella coralliicola]TQV89314.1 MBL fold metallo-hydrolase [Aliikangiella coralliicola]